MDQNIRRNSLYDDDKTLKMNTKQVNQISSESYDTFIELDYGINLDDSIIYIQNDIVIGKLFDFIAKTRTILNNRDDASKNTPITVLLNSDGGDIYEALGIVDFMKSCSVPINVVARGRAMSAAAFILCAATGLRCASKNTTIMVHDIFTDLAGPMSQIRNSVNYADSINETVYDILADSTKRDKTFWKNICVNDFYMSAENALELGLIDKII